MFWLDAQLSPGLATWWRQTFWGSVTVKLDSGEAVVELNDESR